MTVLSGTTTTSSGVPNSDNVLAEDGVYAIFNGEDEVVEVSGFSTAMTDIAQVKLCILAKKGGSSGNIDLELSYELSGVPTGTSDDVRVTDNSGQWHTLHIDISNDRAWTAADIGNLTLIISGGEIEDGREAWIDHAYIEIFDSANVPLSTAGEFKKYIVNESMAGPVVSTPASLANFVVQIQNPVQNTQIAYVSHNGTDDADGWELFPGEAYQTTTEGSTDFYVYVPNTPQKIVVSLHEV